MVDTIAKYFPMKLMMTFNPLETMHSPTKDQKLKQQAVKLSPTKPGSKSNARNTALDSSSGGPQYSSLLKSMRNNNPPQASSPYQDEEEVEIQSYNSSQRIQKSPTTEYYSNTKSTPNKSSPIQTKPKSPSPQKRVEKRESPSRNDPTMKPEV
jgi:hypothetical protein